MTYSVVCFKSTDRTASEPLWEDCLGPQSVVLADLGRAVALWNTRGRPAGRG